MSSLDKRKIAPQNTRMNVISVNITNPVNLGDMSSRPANYFPDLDDESINFNPMILTRKFQKYDFLLVGGGGLLMGHDVTTYLAHINDLAKSGAIAGAAFWGIGTNTFQTGDAYWPGWLFENKLVGVRDWNVKLRWVPCASCMASEFDVTHAPEHEAVVYSNRLRVIRGLKQFPHNDGLKTLEEAIRFIASGRTVITNSYHGMYWGTLLSRKVVVVHDGRSCFHYTRYKPAISDVNSWQHASSAANVYPEALAECREANMKFHEDVSEELAKNAESVW